MTLVLLLGVLFLIHVLVTYKRLSELESRIEELESVDVNFEDSEEESLEPRVDRLEALLAVVLIAADASIQNQDQEPVTPRVQN